MDPQQEGGRIMSDEHWDVQPEELEQTQADRITKSLKYAGISHGEMAEFLEVHRNTVGGWCTGKSKMMPVIMKMWAQKTGVPYEWLRYGNWPAQEAPVKATPRRAAVKKAAGKGPVKAAPARGRPRSAATRKAASR